MQTHHGGYQCVCSETDVSDGEDRSLLDLVTCPLRLTQM